MRRESEVMYEVEGDHKKNKKSTRNYEKTNFVKLNKFFSRVNWKDMVAADEVKHDIWFLF